jgi:hypothetical protein
MSTPNRIRSVAYFRGAGTTQPTLIMLLWAAVAAGTVVIAWLHQPRVRPPPPVVSAADSSVPRRECVSAEP